MADSTTFNEGLAQATRKAPRVRGASRASQAGQLVAWIILLAGGLAAIAPMIQFAGDNAKTWSLMQASDASIGEALEQDWPHSTSPDYLETLAELGLQLPTPDSSSAYVAAQRATRLDPSRAFAWAQLAWLESGKVGGQVNQASLDALVKSMDACPLCDQTLIRWRFNFVLANWRAIPEPVRRRAFEQADLLRWIGPNAEFLAEMRIKSQQNGIPFDAYRAAVNTPVRTWDIGPAPQARAASQPPA